MNSSTENRMSRQALPCLIIAMSLIFSCLMQGFASNKTFFLPRSQSEDAARELMGWQREINLYDGGSHYWTMSFSPVYERSFKTDALSNFLLGGSVFRFSGSEVPNRRSKDILADYFGLPRDFQSTVCFEPRITNFIFDIDFYLGMASPCGGFYLRAHAPIVQTKWDLHLREKISDRGSAFYPAGYMGEDDIPTTSLDHSVEMAMESYVIVDKTLKTLTFGDMREPLQYGKIFGREVRSRLSDIQVALGWNFLQDDWYHFGLNLRTAVPTGNRPGAEYLFEPVVGNGRHWELGMGLTSHVDVWCHEEWSSALYVDANLTHLFSSQQCRSYELKNNGGGSRYMMLEKLHNLSNDLFLGVGGPEAPNQYAQQLVRAINVTTLSSHVEMPVQLDAVIKCAFYNKGLELDLGYNFWYRSAERLTCRNRLPDGYAIKGDAQVYGFDATTDEPIPLNATQHAATIHAGQGVGNFVAGQEFTNANADSPIVATDPGTLVQLTTADSTTLGIAQLPINTSDPAILLTDADINDLSGLMPRSMTHKIFIYAGNRWEACKLVIPYLGLGFDIEIAPHASYYQMALSQFAFTFKLGLSY